MMAFVYWRGCEIINKNTLRKCDLVRAFLEGVQVNRSVQGIYNTRDNSEKNGVQYATRKEQYTAGIFYSNKG